MELRTPRNRHCQRGPSFCTPSRTSSSATCQNIGKISQGYAFLITWDDIKHDPPPKLKIAPIAAIPHKSRGYQMILDLYYGFTLRGTCHPSVNESTTKPDVAPTHALKELSNILPCLIYTVTTAPNNQGPILFSKLDIKDGYW